MNSSFLERKFSLTKRGTNARTEFLAGLTTFMTMSYILIVNPTMLGKAGMDQGGVFTATIISSVIAMLFMGLYANFPFALSAGMGLNAFFTFSIVIGMGHDWSYALTAVFLEGIIFIFLSIFKVREALFKAIPLQLKNAVSVGIGLFIAMIGATNSGIVVANESTFLALGNLVSKEVLVTFFSLLIMGILSAKKVKGALLYGIIGGTILGLILGVTQLPSQGILSLPPSLKPVAFKLHWDNIFTLDMFSVMFTFLFVDIFDTLGTITGVATKANMLDEKGNLPGIGKALLSDAIGTVVGALLGTSTITTFVESASGVTDGGRTGLTSLSVAFFFFLSLFLFPLFSIVPSQATAAALIIVGLFMMSPIKNIDLDDYTESLPAFLTIIMMPFAYSIAEGISIGMISYVFLKVTTGKYKDVSPVMYILAIVFIVRYIRMF
ncbi:MULTISPECIES: NCS2 family permease [Peptoniphilus]|uniref:Probable adenine permease PurP n=1 Tax=Peptoniphilus lacrimalis TaxID=33031 RepID=A0A379C2D9_9FIRM|nr:NCS2 family permease [Peptoniphilus lacrimalis]KGF34960.1 guanine permease [Peptoniphilus lacrimalis DNF00528]MDK7722390.1 NCS2 family permease [Peptoniphilus lacrimalis]MDK7731992.1 NCS2 family permease [Peptoniphilus lacrimalis]MDK8281586.1 NCS2 family permease [Peptoniphilus lacrimalis]SUB56430.1 Probable adenine permease PurP [Peptoniphilus lacrimalis]